MYFPKVDLQGYHGHGPGLSTRARCGWVLCRRRKRGLGRGTFPSGFRFGAVPYGGLDGVRLDETRCQSHGGHGMHGHFRLGFGRFTGCKWVLRRGFGFGAIACGI